MKKIHVSVILILMLFGAAHSVTAQDADGTPQEVALVTAVDGSTVTSTGGGETPVALGAKLPLGAEVVVRSGKTSLVFLTGDFLSLKEGERLTLGATLKESTLQTAGGTRGLEESDGRSGASGGLGTGRTGRVWQAQLASVSGIRGDGMPIAVAPRLAVAGENPVFFWFDSDTSAGAVERGYVLVLKNEENTVIARQSLRGIAGRLNSFRFDAPPQGFVARPRVHWQWSILPEGATAPEGDLDASFVFVDEAGMHAAQAQMRRLETLLAEGVIERSSYHMLQCAYLLDERERLFSDGLPHVIALAAMPGGESYAGEQLAQIFLRLGNQVSSLAPLMLHHPSAWLPK